MVHDMLVDNWTSVQFYALNSLVHSDAVSMRKREMGGFCICIGEEMHFVICTAGTIIYIHSGLSDFYR